MRILIHFLRAIRESPLHCDTQLKLNLSAYPQVNELNFLLPPYKSQSVATLPAEAWQAELWALGNKFKVTLCNKYKILIYFIKKERYRKRYLSFKNQLHLRVQPVNNGRNLCTGRTCQGIKASCFVALHISGIQNLINIAVCPIRNAIIINKHSH